MKKIYSLLLLGGLLLLGVENAWATLPDYVYFKNVDMGGGTRWDAAGAIVGIHFWLTSNTSVNEDADAVLVAGYPGTATAIYRVKVPTTQTWTAMCIYRLNPSNRAWWNNTGDLTGEELPTTTDYYLDNFGHNWTDVTWSHSYDPLITGWNFWYDNGGWTSSGLVRKAATDECATTIITLPAYESSNYQFNITDGTTTLKNTGIMTSSNSTEWSFTEVNSGAWITPASVAGDYLVKYNVSTRKLSIIYPNASYTREVESGKWGTICLPYAVDDEVVSAAPMDFYSVLGVDNKSIPTKLYLKAEMELEAGKPYIFQATEDNPELDYGTSAVAASKKNGLVGTYVATTIDGSDDDDILYVITSNGEVQRAAASCNVGANKAYIKWNEVDVYDPADHAPGVRELPMAPTNATNINAIEESEKTVKFFENGQLRIVREGVTYDAIGRVVR